MRRSIHPRQVRAARALLAMSQEELATTAQVGVATVKRFESGKAIRFEIERSLRSALESKGIIVLEPASTIEGHRIGAGVAIRAGAFAASLAAEASSQGDRVRKRTRTV
jgi:DNA-binding XRE family transcriptional regulator